MARRICIIMGRVYTDLNKQLLDGILTQLHAAQYTAAVFTLHEDSGNEKITKGDLNICRLIPFQQFDGVIYAPYTFAGVPFYSVIDRFLAEECTIPVVRIGIEPDRFLPVWYDDRSETAMLTEHLIAAHGCKDILCLTGPADHTVAQNRLAGFRDAMNAAGLCVSKSQVVYGDFWTYAPQQLAAELADGRRPMPEAVVCASDVMAITLCDKLKEYGIRVPEDIRIVGYDGYTEARMHDPAITTYQTTQRGLGIKAACCLLTKITGDTVQPDKEESGRLLCRESCGCDSRDEPFDLQKFNFVQFEGQFYDQHLSAMLHDAASLNELVANLYKCLFTFMDMPRYGTDNFYLCLCDDWDRTGLESGGQTYRTEGYSERIAFISDLLRTDIPTTALLPDAVWEQYTGETLFFSPLHFQGRCFGYACLGLRGSLQSFNANYVRFCGELSSGLEFLCVQNALKSLAYRQHLSTVRDDLTGLYKIEDAEVLAADVITQAEQCGEFVYAVGVRVLNDASLRDAEGTVAYDRFIVELADLVKGCCTQREKVFIAGTNTFVVMGHESALRAHHFTYEDRVRECYAALQKTNVLYPNIRVDEVVFAPGQRSLPEAEQWLIRKLTLTDKPPHYDAVIGLKIRIYSEPGGDWSVEKCCKELGMSRSYFQKVYQQITGDTYLNDLRISRLQNAKALLIQTNDTMESIAQQCGYEYSYFMRSFKKETGLTPNQFRKQMKQ